MSPKKTTLKPARNVPASTKTPPDPGSLRGVANWKEAAQWLRARGIEDIECITPDLAGVPASHLYEIHGAAAPLLSRATETLLLAQP